MPADADSPPLKTGSGSPYDVDLTYTNTGPIATNKTFMDADVSNDTEYFFACSKQTEQT